MTTVDIDADIVDRARAGLIRAGYERVNVVPADAEHGVAQHASYDRIIVTVGAWDIPPAWLDQLTPNGRMVVPLRFAGITRLIAFVPMQGDGAATEKLTVVTPDVGLRVDQNSARRAGAPEGA